MKKKWTNRMKKWFSEVSDIPEDIVMNLPRMTLIGQSHLSIQNYKSVITFSDKELILAMDQGELHIFGENFMLEVILEKEILLEGFVKTVQFVEH
ncbi:MAG: sporulation protein YqfC [Sporolactobacillus sp.]